MHRRLALGCLCAKHETLYVIVAGGALCLSVCGKGYRAFPDAHDSGWRLSIVHWSNESVYSLLTSLYVYVVICMQLP